MWDSVGGAHDILLYRAQLAYTNKLNANGNKAVSVPPATLGNVLLMRRAPPFIPAHDIVRGIMEIGQATLKFWFMLAVMWVGSNLIVFFEELIYHLSLIGPFRSDSYFRLLLGLEWVKCCLGGLRALERGCIDI